MRLLLWLSFIFLAKTIVCIAQVPENITSELVVLNVKTGEERTILKEQRHFEVPNWSGDGDFLLIHAAGFLEKVDLNGEKLVQFYPDLISLANNDHGISIDGKLLVISKSEPGKSFQIYSMPMDGTSPPRLLTEKYPSYWHGNSPDKKMLAHLVKMSNFDYWMRRPKRS